MARTIHVLYHGLRSWEPGVRESATGLLVTALTAAGCVLHGVLRNTFDATGFFVLSVNGYV